MARKLPEVSKLLLTVTNGDATLMLFSRKRAEGQSKHGRLELLGGRIERTESPLEALVRELGEEEESGLLARRIRATRPTGQLVTLSDAIYHTFRLAITFAEYLELEPGRHESLGFLLVPTTLLKRRGIHDQLTYRTVELLRQLDLLA
jgi:8-oxo-dGTP pyrophosphatase MutT (NUDIX family)